MTFKQIGYITDARLKYFSISFDDGISYFGSRRKVDRAYTLVCIHWLVRHKVFSYFCKDLPIRTLSPEEIGMRRGVWARNFSIEEEGAWLPTWIFTHILSTLPHLQTFPQHKFRLLSVELIISIESAGIETIVVNSVSLLQPVMDAAAITFHWSGRDWVWPTWFNFYHATVCALQEEIISHRHIQTGKRSVFYSQ